MKYLIPNSLKKRLLFHLVFASLLIWGVTAWVSYIKTQDEVTELFNIELAHSAGVLHAFVESMLHEGALSEHWDPDHTSNLLHTHDLTHKYAGKIAFQLWSSEDGMVLRSESAPRFVLAESYNGYSETIIDGYLWHVFSIANNNGEYVIHVGQRDDIRQVITGEIARQLVLQFLLGLPFLGIGIWMIVSHTLSPINHLTEQLSKREAGYLEKLPTGSLPEEIVPVVNELNNLFVQLEQAFENERNFTADASHELRTPLAGLLTQVQVALKTDDERMRKKALKKSQQAVLRMSRMVQQLLTLSRIQGQNENLTRVGIDLNQEIIQVISETEPLAHKKNIDIEFQYTEAIKITGNVSLIDILIRNLVENAVKYSPQNGHIKIRSCREKNKLLLTVEDSGPGIKDEDRERLTQRFFRSVETANNAEGSGLGLSIVQRIATIHDAGIQFSKSSMGGLQVRISFCLPVMERVIPVKKRRTRLFRKKIT